MRQLQVKGFLPGNSQAGDRWEYDIADGLTRIALYCEGGRFAVSRFKDGAWHLVGSRLSEAGVESFLPPGWTYHKLMIFLDGYSQGAEQAFWRMMHEGPMAWATSQPPPATPLRVRAKLALDRLTVPIRRFTQRFTERND
jgi:hypothetical protein